LSHGCCSLLRYIAKRKEFDKDEIHHEIESFFGYNSSQLRRQTVQKLLENKKEDFMIVKVTKWSGYIADIIMHKYWEIAMSLVSAAALGMIILVTEEQHTFWDKWGALIEVILNFFLLIDPLCKLFLFGIHAISVLNLMLISQATKCIRNGTGYSRPSQLGWLLH
jgi:hypothetical protein